MVLNPHILLSKPKPHPSFTARSFEDIWLFIFNPAKHEKEQSQSWGHKPLFLLMWYPSCMAKLAPCTTYFCNRNEEGFELIAFEYIYLISVPENRTSTSSSSQRSHHIKPTASISLQSQNFKPPTIFEMQYTNTIIIAFATLV